MASNMPSNDRRALEWIEAHLEAWDANAGAIGLTAQQVTDITAKAAAARTKLTAAEAKRDQAKSATLDFRNAAGSMKSLASTLISTIKTHAETTANPQVYVLADVSPRDPASPLPPPTQAQTIRTHINNSGQVEFTWKASGNEGAYYVLFRKLTGETVFKPIGDTTEKRFVDGNIPAGTVSAEYYLVSKRGGLTSGASEHVTVNFATVVEQGDQGLSLAA